MEIQLQALTMHVLTSLLYMLQRMNEKKTLPSYPAAKHKNHSKLLVTNIREKPVDIFIVPNRRLH